MKKKIPIQKITCQKRQISGGNYLYRNFTSFLEIQQKQINEKRILANRPIINKIGRLWTFD